MTVSDPRIAQARLSLEGLSVGDAFGEETLKHPAALESRWLSRALPWRWSDDTAMALSVVEVLERFGDIDQDVLAQRFAERYAQDPRRGYGMGARELLRQLGEGASWSTAAGEMFGGTGSYGNGGAMRAPPIGAFFANDVDKAADAGARAAMVTHAHPEGTVGGQAIAVAAALASSTQLRGAAFLEAVLTRLPQSVVRSRAALGVTIPAGDLDAARAQLGNGMEISAQDTVPLCLWVIAHYSEDFTEALWTTAKMQGDADTTCAIVGGIVALRAEIPADWLEAREALPVI